jgi:hypothetical protein
MLDDDTQEPTLLITSTPEVRSLPSPLQAIRAECLSCCGGSAHEGQVMHLHRVPPVASQVRPTLT